MLSQFQVPVRSHGEQLLESIQFKINMNRSVWHLNYTIVGFSSVLAHNSRRCRTDCISRFFVLCN